MLDALTSGWGYDTGGHLSPTDRNPKELFSPPGWQPGASAMSGGASSVVGAFPKRSPPRITTAARGLPPDTEESYEGSARFTSRAERVWLAAELKSKGLGDVMAAARAGAPPEPSALGVSRLGASFGSLSSSAASLHLRPATSAAALASLRWRGDDAPGETISFGESFPSMPRPQTRELARELRRTVSSTGAARSRRHGPFGHHAQPGPSHYS